MALKSRVRFECKRPLQPCSWVPVSRPDLLCECDTSTTLRRNEAQSVFTNKEIKDLLLEATPLVLQPIRRVPLVTVRMTIQQLARNQANPAHSVAISGTVK